MSDRVFNNNKTLDYSKKESIDKLKSRIEKYEENMSNDKETISEIKESVKALNDEISQIGEKSREKVEALRTTIGSYISRLQTTAVVPDFSQQFDKLNSIDTNSFIEENTEFLSSVVDNQMIFGDSHYDDLTDHTKNFSSRKLQILHSKLFVNSWDNPELFKKKYGFSEWEKYVKTLKRNRIKIPITSNVKTVEFGMVYRQKYDFTTEDNDYILERYYSGKIFFNNCSSKDGSKFEVRAIVMNGDNKVIKDRDEEIEPKISFKIYKDDKFIYILPYTVYPYQIVPLMTKYDGTFQTAPTIFDLKEYNLKAIKGIHRSTGIYSDEGLGKHTISNPNDNLTDYIDKNSNKIDLKDFIGINFDINFSILDTTAFNDEIHIASEEFGIEDSNNKNTVDFSIGAAPVGLIQLIGFDYNEGDPESITNISANTEKKTFKNYGFKYNEELKKPVHRRKPLEKNAVDWTDTNLVGIPYIDRPGASVHTGADINEFNDEFAQRLNTPFQSNTKFLEKYDPASGNGGSIKNFRVITENSQYWFAAIESDTIVFQGSYYCTEGVYSSTSIERIQNHHTSYTANDSDYNVKNTHNSYSYLGHYSTVNNSYGDNATLNLIRSMNGVLFKDYRMLSEAFKETEVNKAIRIFDDGGYEKIIMSSNKGLFATVNSLDFSTYSLDGVNNLKNIVYPNFRNHIYPRESIKFDVDEVVDGVIVNKKAYNYTHALVYEPKTGIIIFSKLKDLNCEIYKKKTTDGNVELIASLKSGGSDYLQREADANLLSIINLDKDHKSYLAWIDEMNPQNVFPNYSKSMIVSTFIEDPIMNNSINESEVETSPKSYHLYTRNSVHTPVTLFLFNDITKSFDYIFMGRIKIHDGMEWDGRNSISSRVFTEEQYPKSINMTSMISYGRRTKTLPALFAKFLSQDLLGSNYYGVNGEYEITGGSPTIKAMLPDKRGNLMYLMYTIFPNIKTKPNENLTNIAAITIVNPGEGMICKSSLGATPSRFNSFHASGNVTCHSYGQNISGSTGARRGVVRRFDQTLDGFYGANIVRDYIYKRGDSFGTKIVFDGDYLAILDDTNLVNDDAIISLNVDGRPDMSPIIKLSSRYASDKEYTYEYASKQNRTGTYCASKSYDKYEHKFIKNKIYWDTDVEKGAYFSNFSASAANLRPGRTLRSAYDSIQFNMRRKNHMWNWSIIVKINKNDYSVSNVINPSYFSINGRSISNVCYGEFSYKHNIGGIGQTLFVKNGTDTLATINSQNGVYDTWSKFLLLNGANYNNVKSIFRRTLYRSLSQRNLTDSDNRFRNVEQVVNFGGILERSEYTFYESGKIAHKDYLNDEKFLTQLGNQASNASDIGLLSRHDFEEPAEEYTSLSNENIISESEYSDLDAEISETGVSLGGLSKMDGSKNIGSIYKKHLFERSLDYYMIPRAKKDGTIVHSIRHLTLAPNTRIVDQTLVDSTGINDKANILDPASNIIMTMSKSIAGYKTVKLPSKSDVKIKNTIQFYSTTDTISWLGIKMATSQDAGKTIKTYSDLLRVRVFNSKTGIGTSNEFVPMQYFTIIPNINDTGKDLWFVETVDIENYTKNGSYIHYRLAPTLFGDNFGHLEENANVFPFGTASDIWSNEWKTIKINENISERDYPNYPRCSFILSSYYDKDKQKLVCFLSSTKSYGFAETMKDKFNLFAFNNMASWDKPTLSNAYVAMQNNQSPDYSTLVFDLRDLENLTFEVGKSKTWKAWSMFDNDSLQYEYDNMKRLIGEDSDGKYLIHPNSGVIYDLNDYLNIKPRKNQRMKTTQVLYNNIRNSFVYITNTDDESFNDERYRFKLPVLKEVPQNVIEIKEKGFYEDVIQYLNKRYEENNGKDLLFQISVKMRSDDTNLAGATEKFKFTEIGVYNPYSRNNKIIRYVDKISSFDDYMENELVDHRTQYLNDSLYTIKKLANRRELVKRQNMDLFFGKKLSLKHTQMISEPLEGFDVDNAITVPAVAEVIIYPTVAEFYNISYLIDRTGRNFREAIDNETNNMLRGWINGKEIRHSNIDSNDESVIDKTNPNNWKIEWKLSNPLAPKSIAPISPYRYDVTAETPFEQAVIMNKKAILYNEGSSYYERDMENDILTKKSIEDKFEIENLDKIVVSPKSLKDSQILVAGIKTDNVLKKGFFVLYNDKQYKIFMQKYLVYDFDKDNNLWVVFKDTDGKWYVKVYEIQYINKYVEFKETASYYLSDVPKVTNTEKQDETVYLLMDDVQGDAFVVYPKLEKIYSIGFDTSSDGKERRVISKEFTNPNYLDYKPFAARNSNEIYLIERGDTCFIDPSIDASWVDKRNISLIDPEILPDGQESGMIREGYSKVLQIKLYNHDGPYKFDTVDNEFLSIGTSNFELETDDKGNKISTYKFPVTLKKTGVAESIILTMTADLLKNSVGIKNKTMSRKLEFKFDIGVSPKEEVPETPAGPDGNPPAIPGTPAVDGTPGAFEVLSTNKESLAKSGSKIKKIKFSDNVSTSYDLDKEGLALPTDTVYIKDAVVLRDNSLLVLVEKYYGYDNTKSKYLGQTLLILDINKNEAAPTLIDLGKDLVYSKKDSVTFDNINNSLVGNIMYDMNSNELLLLPHKESNVFELHSFKVNYITKNDQGTALPDSGASPDRPRPKE